MLLPCSCPASAQLLSLSCSYSCPPPAPTLLLPYFFPAPTPSPTPALLQPTCSMLAHTLLLPCSCPVPTSVLILPCPTSALSGPAPSLLLLLPTPVWQPSSSSAHFNFFRHGESRLLSYPMSNGSPCSFTGSFPGFPTPI